MNHVGTRSDTQTKALIYCRVSDKKQKTQGHGLESQEHRCRKYAQDRGYEVEMVFPDDITGGVDFMKRPGMRAMLAYLDAKNEDNYVVIFDDPKRFARHTEFHLKLRREFAQRGARVECLNFTFEDTPEGLFVETVIAAQGQLEREQNRRQVIQKMTARVEKGYYVFHPPIGYKYERVAAHGKILVPNEPIASIIREALEGFADGRFTSQVEVKRFLEGKPDFPKSGKSGYVHPTKVRDMLERSVYAGCVEAPNWGVTLRKGHHEALISFSTYERIQARLKGTLNAPARKDINQDFPLRGFVLCDDCGEPMTSCWSKGRNQLYPYYLCDTPSCDSKRKSIRRADIEEGAEALLRSLQPAAQLFKLAKAIFTDIWEMRRADALGAQKALEAQLNDTSKQIDNLLDRIMNSSSPSVIGAYEKRIEELEREKIRLAERAESAVPSEVRLSEFIEPAMTFLASPWNIYKNGNFALKRTVLKLAFAEPLRYSRNEGYRTAETTFPFKVLADFSSLKCGMVGDPGIEPGMGLPGGVTVRCRTLQLVARSWLADGPALIVRG
ncbi:Site-specific DNA recombinase [Pseudooceanicola nitratireducens]|uniref:Site-specific DNA recombinase n=1 Tax=Pseudooceanicola nitratireducens TaxID=517719 RepID=A0A1I1LUA4_9RHOB|nr:Site-specific DNA recombinase [Pseudooceanicola nitratireducens]SFC76062.1 Site-specific DNA recombinase [Pseudooceanicola nitratireducens]